MRITMDMLDELDNSPALMTHESPWGRHEIKSYNGQFLVDSCRVGGRIVFFDTLEQAQEYFTERTS